MRGVAWNCRGLGQTSTVRELKSLLRSRSPDFVFLTELKVDANPLEGSMGRDPFIPFISQLVESRGLINMHIQGDMMTWDNHRSGKNHVKSALDKGIVNGAWLQLFPKTALWSVQTSTSDHRPLCLDTGGIGPKFSRCFKFEESWTRDCRSNLIVANAWDSVAHPWAPARVFKKIGATRVALLQWNRTQFGKIDGVIRELEQNLDQMQQLPAGSRNWNSEIEVRRRLNEARAKKAIYWKQRARISWLKDGDKCSKFFFLSAAIRGRRNAIECILNKNNEWINDRTLIGHEFLDFFNNIFSSSDSNRLMDCGHLFREKISIENQADVVCCPSREEIRRTLFAMSNHKAPGPDGMSVLFFKHYWESVGDDFCDAVEDFFVNGRMHRGLIRRILKPILPSLICPTQATFVPGRNIQDNNVMVQEIIHSFNRKKGKEGFFAIKIDLVKAYDRVSWKFIDHVLQNFGFPQQFCSWVSQCITTSSLNICLNGGPVGKILPSCGLRQGDPLSPYLFICAAEVLSRLLEEELGKGIIHGIKLSRGGPVLSHVFFADDLILVGRANLLEAKGFWNCLEKFCEWSGQKVNKLKTSIFFSKNTPDGMRRGIKEALGLDSPEGVTKYLGLPLFRSRQKDADFNFILDNLTSKLQGWKAKTLSKGGRATLIKSVGLSMPIYAMQTTKLSNRLVNRIDGLIRDFWWGFEKGNHGLHLRAWDKLCLPKSLGGLGFRKTREMNLAFLAKWGWNLLSGKQSLCSKILEAKYLRGREFLNCSYKDSDSWFWKNVVKASTILRKGACKRVADGRDISIWRDPWIPHLKGFVPKPKEGVVQDNNYVADLLTPGGGWDMGKLHNLFDHETISAILKDGFPPGSGKDSWLWTLESNGQFSCKSAYLAQALERAPYCDVAPSLWNKLWNSKIMERQKVLWWCILSNALPVRAVIRKRFPIDDSKCPLCGGGEETMEHLFLTCDVAMHLWPSSPWGIFPMCDSGIRVWDWVKFIWSLNNRGVKAEDVFLYASIVVDNIWRMRNDAVHNNIPPDILKCIDIICSSFAEIHTTFLPSPSPLVRDSWIPPPLEWIKFNCNVRVGLESMCLAVVARNHLGRVMSVHTSRLGFCDALCGEAAACCLAIELQHKFIIVESDSRIVINALNGKASHWALENYVSFCTKSSPFFIGCNFSNISRSCNFMAHNVAYWAFNNQMYGSIPIDSLPENILCNDRED
ncbi:uncharacterized protein LOC133036015 [Cannabis sativa]|uniref:uncharacterized protein LOC133036015 n=1 Tax=Cannabis sativa TaxID=3483 RepID=UPI0029C9D58B|nr:uncharacterized protein LOC133036015 [Cannabis sativa]